MKKKICFIVVMTLILINITPLIQSHTTSPPIQTINSQKPIWKIGDQWDYSLRIYFPMEGGEINGDIQITSNPLSVIVEEMTSDQYQLSIQGPVNANIFLDLWPIGIRGNLEDASLNGHLLFDSENLTLENVTVHFDGILKISFVRVDINFDLDVMYQPSLQITKFPLQSGKEWESNTSIAYYNGVINVPGVNALIAFLFPDENDEIPDQFDINTNETFYPTLYRCTDTQTRSIGNMGSYECFVVDSVNMTYYYCPIFGTIVRFEPNITNTNTQITLNLQSSTYTIPGAPSTPSAPSGQTLIEKDVSYQYQTSSTDDELDEISYYFDWDDGTNTGWIGPYPSGEPINVSHSWSDPDTYQVRVRAKDTNDLETRWSDALSVTLPKSKTRIIPFISWFWEKLIEFFDFINHGWEYCVDWSETKGPQMKSRIIF